MFKRLPHSLRGCLASSSNNNNNNTTSDSQPALSQHHQLQLPIFASQQQHRSLRAHKRARTSPTRFIASATRRLSLSSPPCSPELPSPTTMSSSPSILLPQQPSIAQPDDKLTSRHLQDAVAADSIAPCLPSSLSTTPPPTPARSPISASAATLSPTSSSSPPTKPTELCYQAAYHRELRITAPPKVHFPPMHKQLPSSPPALFLSVRCPPDLRSFSTSIYAIALLTIDGRRYRLQGWLSRTSTCQMLPSDPAVTLSAHQEQLICVSTSHPVWLISRIQNRAERDLDWLVGEWNVGKEGLLSSGSYRFVAVVRDLDSGNVYMSEPTHHAVDVRVDDDWEFVNGQPASLQDMIDHYQDKPLCGMDMKTPLRHHQYSARWESPVDVIHGFREEW